MWRLCALPSALLLLLANSVYAAPITLQGKTVRFMLDDTQLTAFGGAKPTVQGDVLIFSPPTTAYRADALAPSTPVSFKEQALEFKVEALAGQSINSVTFRSSGLRTQQGKSVLNAGFAYGKFNTKDQFLVNRSIDFEAVDASSASWQALNVSTDPKGTEASVQNLTSRSIDIALTHQLRALALDKTGSASIDAQDGVSFTVTTKPATDPDRIFNWAEGTFTTRTPITTRPLLRGGTTTLTLTNSASYQCQKAGETCNNLDGLVYRCYPELKQCFGFTEREVYSYSYSDQIIRIVGPIQPYIDQASSAGY